MSDDAAGRRVVFGPLLKIEDAGDRGRYAPGMRAGRWVFATGLVTGGAAPPAPDGGPDKLAREAGLIFDRLGAILRAGGSAFDQVLRLDQYYPGWHAVGPYQGVRRARFGAYVPPSTSVVEKGLLLPGAEIAVEAIAAVPGHGLTIEAIVPQGLAAPKQAGYTAVVRAGDYVFVAGQVARGPQGGELAPEIRGAPIGVETAYVVERRLAPALAAARASLDDLVKVQAYLADAEDVAGFLAAWARFFPGNAPALTIVPTAKPGFGTPEARLEISAIAFTPSRRGDRSNIYPEGSAMAAGRLPAAVRAGDLVLFSGLMAAGRSGATVAAQMRQILATARGICAAAGTDLANVVRIQQFHLDLADLRTARQAWEEALPGRFLPLSAICVPAPLPAPGASVLVDLWVYVPPRG